MKSLPLLFFLSLLIADAFARDIGPRHEYTLMLSYIMPQGKFADPYLPGTYPQPGEALTQSTEGEVGGVGARKGLGLDFSGYYYMNDNPVPTVGGVKITFLHFANVPFRWYTAGDYVYNAAHYTDLRLASFNVGPVVKINIGDYAALRLYTQLCAAVGWNGGWSNGIDYTYVDATNEYFVHQDANLKFKGGSGFKSESGVVFNASSFVASLGFSFGKIAFDKMEYNTSSVTEIHQYDQPSGTYKYLKTTTTSQKINIGPHVPTSYLFFSAGFMF